MVISALLPVDILMPTWLNVNFTIYIRVEGDNHQRQCRRGQHTRAHITNGAAIKCLRDIGLQEETMRLGQTGENLKHVRRCHSMAGEKFGQVYTFGNGLNFFPSIAQASPSNTKPVRRQEYQAASPCRHIDLAQNLLEPILI